MTAIARPFAALSPRFWRDISVALTGLGAIVAAFYWLQLTQAGGGVDAHYFYFDRPIYHPELGANSGYNYSPAFELVMAPLRLLSFPAFVALLRAALLGLVVWMAGPFTLPLLFWMPLASEVNAANIQIVLAAAICVGFRYPSAWAFVLLTKATPGLGLAWFAVRREWRPLLIALGTTAIIAAVSFVLAPDAWRGYVSFMLHGDAAKPCPPWNWPFLYRLPLALGVVVLSAWRGWRPGVVIASTLALPVFYTISPSMLVGAVWLARRLQLKRTQSNTASIVIAA